MLAVTRLLFRIEKWTEA